VAGKLARGLLWTVALLAAALIVAGLATMRAGDRALYPAAGPSLDAYVLTNGWHSGVAIPRAALSEVAARDGLAALTMVTNRFAAYSWLEIGYGELEFYRSVPTVADITPAIALRVLFRPGNEAVLHVVGLDRAPPAAFPQATTARIALGQQGFARMAARIDKSFAGARAPMSAGLPAEEVGPGLYGPSLFFRAAGHFHLFNLCNHWVADMLDAAGLPTTPVLDTLARGLLLDLRWRSGAQFVVD